VGDAIVFAQLFGKRLIKRRIGLRKICYHPLSLISCPGAGYVRPRGGEEFFFLELDMLPRRIAEHDIEPSCAAASLGHITFRPVAPAGRGKNLGKGQMPVEKTVLAP